MSRENADACVCEFLLILRIGWRRRVNEIGWRVDREREKSEHAFEWFVPAVQCGGLST